MVPVVDAKLKTLISPCGLYCSACPVFLARTDASLRQRLAEARGVTPDKVFVCAGCKPMQGRVFSAPEACPTWVCATGRKVEFCYECPDFPCLKLAPCADRAQELPHNTKVYNLVLLQKEGAEVFAGRYRDRIRQYLRGKKPHTGGEIQS